MSGLRIGSLCSGYEGLGLAVMDVLGGELAWVADNDPGASKILAHRFPGVPNHGDITTADWGSAEPVDVLTAGFPCQPVSAAGRRKGISDERWLFDDIAEALGRMVARPRLLLLENVAGLLSANGGHAMARVVHGLAALGYVGRYRLLRASDVGAPHKRERWFCVAWPAADTRSDQSERGRVAGVLAGPARGAEGAGRERQRDGDAARGGGADAADAYRTGEGRLELPPRRHEPGGRPAGSSEVPADAERDRLEGSRAAAGKDQGRQAAPGVRCRPAQRGLTPEDADRAAGGERRLPAPGQAPGGWPRADTGGPGGARVAADPDDQLLAAHARGMAGGEAGREREHPGAGRGSGDRRGAPAPDADSTDAGPRRGRSGAAAPAGPLDGTRGRGEPGPGIGGGTAAHTQGDGRDEGRPEPARLIGRPDATERGDGLAAHAASDTGRLKHGDDVLPGGRADGRGPAAGGSAPADADSRGCESIRITEPAGEQGAPWREPDGCHPDGRLHDTAGGSAAADAERGTGIGRPDEPFRRPHRGAAAAEHRESDIDWGAYGPAIARWEAVLGRPAPRPTEPGRTGERLSPRFVEWMMGLTAGWVTDVPGLSRNQQLHALGNGVVPQQAVMALRRLLDAIESGEAA